MTSPEDYIIERLSHEHPLIFNNEESLDTDVDMKPKFCSICGLAIFINSYYSCSDIEQGCYFLVHEKCARQLPRQLSATPVFNSVMYDRYVGCRFSLCGPNDLDIPNKNCLKCGQICKNYTYSNQYGHFHPLCLVPLEIVTKHRSHDHPLSAMRKEICGVCNACGEEEKGFFLSCQTCDYWISQDCALLPPVAMHAYHSHPLVLFYTNFHIDAALWFTFNYCRICKEYLGVKSFYSCGICQYNVHVKCIKSSTKNMAPEEWRKLIVHLPAATEDTVFSSLIANLEQDEEVDATSMSIIMSRLEECHKHQLILRGTRIVDEVVDDMETGQIWGSKTLCNACINPINSSTPYYSCSVAKCHFLLHEFCARLPSRIRGKFLDPSTWFLFTKCEEFVSVFCCLFCKFDCNGFGYRERWGGACIDVECALAPRIIKHASHKNHYFHLTATVVGESDVANCCHVVDPYTRYYKCTSCPAFKIHLRCALLPREVRHKFDKHPLQLIADSGNLIGLSIVSDRKYLENCGFCEVCEKPIDPRIWFYYCSECDQYFHVKCIPSVGELSKLKFGGTLDHVGCHDHPVTSVRMLTIGSQKCTYCEKIIEGFEDDRAFHCESCDVWIHNHCARNSVNR